MQKHAVVTELLMSGNAIISILPLREITSLNYCRKSMLFPVSVDGFGHINCFYLRLLKRVYESFHLAYLWIIKLAKPLSCRLIATAMTGPGFRREALQGRCEERLLLSFMMLRIT